MQRDEQRRRSHWLMRVMEWDDPRARYPNIWHDGMPRHVLAFETVAGRLRLGDLIAVYHPASSKHRERSDRFVGIATVAGLRRTDEPGQAWIDLEAAHRFEVPVDLGRQPRRVFMCADAGWPGPEVELFEAVWNAAVAAGWEPPPDEPTRAERRHREPGAPALLEEAEGTPEAASGTVAEPAVTAANVRPDERLFAGADICGGIRDARAGTWLALVALAEDRLRVVRLEPKGRHGLQGALRDPDRDLMRAEAIGLGFPFGLPEPFAETLLGGEFPAEGWWGLAKCLERLSFPGYLTALQEFRDEHGELKRLTDERPYGCSPLQRDLPDMGSKGYHGIRMIAEDRSRFAIRPFENAQGKLLLEVFPEGAMRTLAGRDLEPGEPVPAGKVLEALCAVDRWPLDLEGRFRDRCVRHREALEAVVAAHCAAVAVLSGEADRSPEDLAPGSGVRVRREGWIYGLPATD